MFIVFEGIDGSGKSTLIDSVSKILKQQRPDLKVIETEEPYYLRDLVKRDDLKFTDFADLLLFSLDRKLHIDNIIKPNLESSNTIILCDRYWYSTFAYQKFLTTKDKDLAEKLNSHIVEDCNPYIVFYIDIDVETALLRQTDKDRISDRDKAYFEWVKHNYNYLKSTNPNFYVLSGDKTVGSLANEVVSVINTMIGDLDG